MLMRYRITNAGKPAGAPLVGCIIDEVSTNKWEFKEGAKVWATGMGALPTFILTGFHGFNWTVKANTVSMGTPPKMSGSWENDQHGEINDSDSWTAEGTGKEKGHEKEGQDEAHTAAAK